MKMNPTPANQGRFHSNTLWRYRRSAALIFAFLGAGLTGIVRGQVVTEFTISTAANSYVDGITSGPDGNLWFTFNGANDYTLLGYVGRITPVGIITLFPIPFRGSPSLPAAITAGPDGNLWFTEISDQIGRITPAGVITEFPVPTTGGEPSGIVAGPDGNLWFTEGNGNKIGRITTAGVVTEFTVPTAKSKPYGIATGPDGNLWFTEHSFFANLIGRITTAGVVTEFPIPTAFAQPRDIAAGPDGSLWFTEQHGNQIGRITTAGVVTEFLVPTAFCSPGSIAAATDGNLWFGEQTASNMGRITTAGVITEFSIPSQAQGITSGPDGALWFTESSAAKIGRITTSGSPTCTADTHTLCLNDRKFSISATFQTTPTGPSAPAMAVPLTNDTGYFWFFDPTNVELVVKVLTGCAVNDDYWVFAGGLTNVGVELKVTDTLTGAIKMYSNPVGTPFQPIQDTSAFACP